VSIADEKYVSITTTKRNGDTVSSPVWIAPLGDGTAGFTTEATSGKAKRIRNFPSVTLQPCDARGRLKSGSQPVTATAAVVLADDLVPITKAIKAKYGVTVTLFSWAQSIRNIFTRGPAGPRAGIHLTLQGD
jgi:PPOX class probable F420-dependent enzyme